jgi:hypothetical protein
MSEIMAFVWGFWLGIVAFAITGWYVWTHYGGKYLADKHG